MKILVVEDEPQVAQTLKVLLASFSYAVDIATDGETGLQLAEAFTYDLMLLDLILPGLDGIGLCQQLRKQGVQTPILLLTGQGGAAHQKAMALHAGADDYVTKPFDAEELMARVQALLRRGEGKGGPILTWGQLSVDPKSQRVSYGPQPLTVTPKEYAILELLLRRPHVALSARMILDQAWNSLASPGEGVVRTHIKELRQKLIAAGAPQDFLKTVYRVGYRLNPAYAQTPITQTASLAEDLEAVTAQLRATQAELAQTRRDLETARQTLAQARQPLQVTCSAPVPTRIWLQPQQDQWRALFDHALDAIAITDDEGRYIDANPAACELFGLAQTNLLQARITDFADPSLDLDSIWQQFLDQGEMTGEFPLHRPDGTIRHAEFAAIANFIPGRHLSILRDITERKQLEAERQQTEADLTQSERKLRAVFDSTFEFMGLLTPDGILIDANRTALDIVAVDLAEVLGQPFWETPWWNHFPEQQQILREAILRAASGEFVRFEAQHILADGTQSVVDFSLKPVFDEAGQVVMLVPEGRDITARKQAELALQRQIQQEQLLADIAQDIRQSLDLEIVLSRTVNRVRQFLDTDRVVIFRFRPDWQGDVMMESVGADWQSILATTIADPCVGERYIEPYRQGHVSALADIDSEGLTPCYVELLRQYQVKANLAVPILQGDHLWGLLVAHHCAAPRQWKPAEIAVLQRLATKVGIAIQQSELYEQTRRELIVRQQMQAVLEENEARFRSLNAAAPIAICQADADGLCRYNNIRWQQMSGLSFEESLGTGWLAAVHPDDQAGLAQAWTTFLQTDGQFSHEFRLLTPQGEIRWVATQAAAMKSPEGEVIGYVSIGEDITERKLAAQTIQEQAALLDIASDAIFVRDLDHHILYWNKGAEHLYGWNAAEAIGRRVDDLLGCDSQQLTTTTQTLLRQGEWQGEFRDFTKTHQPVIVAARWTLVRDQAGQPKSILSVITDITEKKHLEAQFYQAQRLESLGRLASGIAHDLNNVFTPILAIAQLLRLTQRHLDAKAQEQLKILEDSTKRGVSMVQQILTITRGSSGDRNPIDLTPLLQEVIGVIQQSFPKSILIRQDIPPIGISHSLQAVAADPTHLHQVIMNLCVNARDAMPNGGVLTITAANTRVDGAMAQSTLAAQVGPYVVITVTDTGTGIAPEVRDRMFDPFFTTKALGKGTGLGLATVLGIVKNHGGFLQVTSEVGQGTQIQVYLPALATAVGDQDALTVPPETPRQGQGALVLVVDDDSSVQQTTQTLLESHHYTTLVANDGVAALAVYAQHQHEIRLVVLDVMMPNMDGIELVKRLKQINPQLRIIAISGLPENRKPALDAGAAAFLVKPYSLETLLGTVCDLIA